MSQNYWIMQHDKQVMTEKLLEYVASQCGTRHESNDTTLILIEIKKCLAECDFAATYPNAKLYMSMSLQNDGYYNLSIAIP